MTMTTDHHQAPETAPSTWAGRIVVREMWGTLAIVTMWMAVLFVGVFGGDMVFRGADTSSTTMPAGVAVALFAAIGTGSVAKRVFGQRPAHDDGH